MRYNNRKSKTIRQSSILLRNEYNSDNKWGIPCIGNDKIDIKQIKLLGFNNAKSREQKNCDKTIHFFVDDDKLERVYVHPERYIKKLAQYKHIITPDFSMYPEMPLVLQQISVFKSRWCGAYWNDMGLSVIPSINWGTEKSFDFAFLGIKKGSIIAVSTVGSRKCKQNFMAGYNVMLKEIEPKYIICYGKPFSEMNGNIVTNNYPEITGRAG